MLSKDPQSFGALLYSLDISSILSSGGGGSRRYNAIRRLKSLLLCGKLNDL